jgi:hypothetical protein
MKLSQSLGERALKRFSLSVTVQSLHPPLKNIRMHKSQGGMLSPVSIDHELPIGTIGMNE